jgi:hypothetical protein
MTQKTRFPFQQYPVSEASPLIRFRLGEQQSTSLRIWPLQHRYHEPCCLASWP